MLFVFIVLILIIVGGLYFRAWGAGSRTVKKAWKKLDDKFPTTYAEAKRRGKGEGINLFAGILAIALFLVMFIYGLMNL